MYGPLEYVLFQFDDDRFLEEILPKMIESKEKGCVEIVDLVFITKDKEDEVTIVEVSELLEEDAVLFEPLIKETFGLLTVEDIALAARDLLEGTPGAVLLLEHRWAVDLRNAVHAGGGSVLDSAYISPPTHAKLVAEMEQMEAGHA